MVDIDSISKANETLNKLIAEKWISKEVFTLRWWGLVSFLTFSYIFSFLLLDKRRLVELLLFGSLIAVFAVVADILVSNFNYLIYNINLIPMIPSIFIYDITALPLFYMLIYQYTDSWKKYSIWALLASLAMGYIFSPLMVKLGYLKFIDWSYTKAFLIIAFIAFLAKAVISLIISLQEKSLRSN